MSKLVLLTEPASPKHNVDVAFHHILVIEFTAAGTFHADHPEHFCPPLPNGKQFSDGDLWVGRATHKPPKGKLKINCDFGSPIKANPHTITING